MLRAARILAPRLTHAEATGLSSCFRTSTRFLSTGTSRVVDVSSDEHFQKELESARENGNLAVVDFSAKWCGPCKVIAPIYSQLSTLYPDTKFLKVDIDQPEVESTVRSYDISSVPTFAFFKDGEQKVKFSGADVAALRNNLESLS